MIICMFICVDYVFYVCKLMPWTLESMRKLELIELSWRKQSWVRAGNYPIFVVTVSRDLGTFFISKNSENFCGHSPRCYLKLSCFMFRFGHLDAQKNKKIGLCVRLPEKDPNFQAFCTFLDGSLNDLQKLWNFIGTFLRMLVTTFMF